MRSTITLTGLFCVAVLGLCGIPRAAHAQGYPTRPITLVVPFPAGGPSDVVARIVAEQMGKVLGQTLVIENVGGAGGTIGSARVASAAPDGYTLLAGSMGSHVSAPVLTPNVKYDFVARFRADRLHGSCAGRDRRPQGFSGERPARVPRHLKQNGEAVKQAHGGIGASSHMACLLFTAATGTKPTLIAYRGTGPAMNDLIGGHVDFFCEQAVSVSGQITSGAIKAYAVSSSATACQRCPTCRPPRSSGVDYQMSIWAGIFAPKGVSREIIEKLAGALDSALDDPGVAEAPCRPWRRGAGQGRAHAREIRCLREGRDRALVADPQGRICHSELTVLLRSSRFATAPRGPRQCFAAAKLAMLRMSRVAREGASARWSAWTATLKN